MVHRLILQQVFGRVPDLALSLRREALAWRPTVRIMIKTLWTSAAFDSGDLELCFGSSEMALSDIEKRAEEILGAGKFPLLLGGEHLVTLAAGACCSRKISGSSYYPF